MSDKGRESTIGKFVEIGLPAEVLAVHMSKGGLHDEVPRQWKDWAKGLSWDELLEQAERLPKEEASHQEAVFEHETQVKVCRLQCVAVMLEVVRRCEGKPAP